MKPSISRQSSFVLLKACNKLHTDKLTLGLFPSEARTDHKAHATPASAPSGLTQRSFLSRLLKQGGLHICRFPSSLLKQRENPTLYTLALEKLQSSTLPHPQNKPIKQSSV
ncbi:hypothetical protein KIL84_018959 [Mauremys mutica]|uniref:Uncharacterized protein n=1 Tax=Mauremys mutica TaxID=74926 RepID=A0A9D4BA67_9SAUR|nr:hypothetical protein KIL84_018959 [Mauremys mutica]